ncbi:hypothetical protein [uncultured Thermomonospora sp.]|uniref:hypothetical protein n=1 Tax=uncultured Thermomonospora sp. TaxID=671175 RepID=UPI00259B024D|nr:hypothetical protein [uncultured Thermomonospora sp.]
MSNDTAPLAALLERYRTVYEPGSAGDAQVRALLRSDVTDLHADRLRADSLTDEELNDLIAYCGWNVWDMLGKRATEGESGLIPRQEYETIAGVEQYSSYPALFELITDAVGAEGLIEMGATARREIGTKVNLLHAWCCCMPLLTGRGFALGLGLIEPGERRAELAEALQFSRRLYRGMWGEDGQMFATGRSYRSPLLAGTEWLDRFVEERVELDGDRRAFYTTFNASTQLLAFLLHMDCRLGLSDSGPYLMPDGRVLIVRDHFLHDPAYSWFDISSDLPHAVTQALFFGPPEGMEFTVNDLSTTFTDPPAYLPYLSAVAVYARDRWDTPVEQIRPLGEAEMDSITRRSREKTMQLYKKFGAMSREELVDYGVQMYVVDMVLPFLRLAGVVDRAVEELNLYGRSPLTHEAYDKLMDPATAAEVLPRVLIGGFGFVPVTGRDPLAPARVPTA